MINILLIDCSSLNSDGNSKQNSRDYNLVDIKRYFEFLKSQNHPHLYMTTADGINNIEQMLDIMEHDLRPKLIISLPFSLEIEIVAERYEIPYYGLQHISLDSKHVNGIVFHNQKVFSIIRDQLLESFRHKAPYSCISDQINHPLTPTTNWSQQLYCTGICKNDLFRFSPLTDELAFYSRFQPLPAPRANVFYEPNVSRLLLVMDDVLDHNFHQLQDELTTTITSLAALTNNRICLIIFGQRRRRLLRLKSILSDLPDLTIEIVQDHFSFKENSIHSIIQKCDVIITSDMSLGFDAIALRKPVVFTSSSSNITSLLDTTWHLSDNSNLQENFPSIGNIQYNCLHFILYKLSNQGYLLNNHSYSASELYHHSRRLLNNSKHSLPSDLSDLSRQPDPVKYTSSKPIFNPTHSTMCQARKYYQDYKSQLIIYRRKLTKFQNDPKAFFTDSKIPIFRLLAPFL